MVSVTPPTRSGGHLRLSASVRHSFAVKPEIVGVASTNMQWGHFVCHSSSQKRESTAFDLILRSDWGLSGPSKQVGRSSTPCRKGAKFGVEKVNGGQSICNRVASVGNGKNVEKEAQSSKGYYIYIYITMHACMQFCFTQEGSIIISGKLITILHQRNY